MAVNFANALTAYANAAARTGKPGLEPRSEAAGGDFAKLLRDTAQSVTESLRSGEEMSIRAAAGEADLVDVVTAVNNAEMTLQTVVAVRDQVIQAYNDIIRMPI